MLLSYLVPIPMAVPHGRDSLAISALGMMPSKSVKNYALSIYILGIYYDVRIN